MSNKIEDWEIVYGYLKGLNDRQIADKKDMSSSSITRRRNKLGMKPNGIDIHKGNREEVKKKIKQLNEKGLSDHRISKKLDIPFPTVNSLRREMGLEKNSQSTQSVGKEYEKALDYVKKEDIVISRADLIEKFDLNSKKTLGRRCLNDEEIGKIAVPNKTVNGIGTPKLFGKYSGKTLIYTDKRKIRKALLTECKDIGRARQIKSIDLFSNRQNDINDTEKGEGSV